MARITVDLRGGKPKSKKPAPPRTEKQLAALHKHAYPKGVSGNPGGCPKGTGEKLISKSAAAFFEQEVPDAWKKRFDIENGPTGKPVTWADLLAFAAMVSTIDRATTINLDTFTELREITEGKLPDKVEATGKNGSPLAAPVLNVNFTRPQKPVTQSTQPEATTKPRKK